MSFCQWVIAVTVCYASALAAPRCACAGTVYYVSPDGEDSAARDGKSVARPWKSLAYACKRVPAGTEKDRNTIILTAGEYEVTQSARLKSGVNIRGEGRAGAKRTLLRLLPLNVAPPSGAAKAPFGLDSLIIAENVRDIKISGLALDGAKAVALASPFAEPPKFLFGDRIENIEITDFDAQNFPSLMSLFDSKRVKIHDFTARNTSAYFGASIGFIGDTDAARVYNGVMVNKSGFGGEACNFLPEIRSERGGEEKNPPGIVSDVKIYNIVHDTERHPARAEVGGDHGEAFSIESRKVLYDRTEIYHCTFNGTLSMLGGSRPNAPYGLRIHNNQWENCPDYSIEMYVDRTEIDHNLFHEGGAYPIAGFTDAMVNDLWIHHNVFECLTPTITIALHQTFPAANLRFDNNTFFARNNDKLEGMPLRVLFSDKQNGAGNTFRNNIVYCQNFAPDERKVQILDVSDAEWEKYMVSRNVYYNLGLTAGAPRIGTDASFLDPGFDLNAKTLAGKYRPRNRAAAGKGAFVAGDDNWTAGASSLK